MKLTITAIEKMEYNGDGKSRDVRWDDQVAGFGVRLYPSGKKSFVLSYRFNARKRLMVLGAVGVMSLRTLALISRIFGLARRWGYVPEDHVNPARGIDKF